MARQNMQAATEKLLKQASGDFGLGRKFQAPEPAAAMYGVFGPQYAASLGATTGAAGADILNQAALRNESRNEAERYAEQLAAAHAASLAGIDREGMYGLQLEALKKEPDGLIGMRSVGRNASGEGYGIFNDPILAAAANDLAINESEADKRLKNAQSNAANYTAGLRTDPDVAARRDTPALQSEQEPTYGIFDPSGFNPGHVIGEYTADEGKTVEQQMEMARLKAAAKASGMGEDEYEVTLDPAGRPTLKVKGPGAVGLYNEGAVGDPNIPNPKAGAQGGGASATPATGFYSNPNSKRGMRRDPITGEQRMHKGDDFSKKEGTPFPAEKDGKVVSVGPMKGFGPNTVVVEYNDGSQVLYGHGKQANVKPGQIVTAGMPLGLVGSLGRSTGPHVHRQLLRGPQREPVQTASGQPTRVDNSQVLLNRAKRMGLQASASNDGSVAVTMKDGTVRRYDRSGKRIG